MFTNCLPFTLINQKKTERKATCIFLHFNLLANDFSKLFSGKFESHSLRIKNAALRRFLFMTNWKTCFSVCHEEKTKARSARFFDDDPPSADHERSEYSHVHFTTFPALLNANFSNRYLVTNKHFKNIHPLRVVGHINTNAIPKYT
jgi:hypothetical protein